LSASAKAVKDAYKKQIKQRVKMLPKLDDGFGLHD
jgi:hypothetical protein